MPSARRRSVRQEQVATLARESAGRARAANEHPLLQLQRAVGNGAVASLVVARSPTPHAGAADKDHRTLRQGDAGPEVQKLQGDIIFWIQARGLDVPDVAPGFPETGKFDANTTALVKYAQKLGHLPENGVAGPEVWALVQREVDDYQLLLLEQGEDAFLSGSIDLAFEKFWLYRGKAPNATAAAIATYRVAACLHRQDIFDRAAKEYADVARSSGADDKLKGAALENEERARNAQPFMTHQAVNNDVQAEITAEIETYKKRYKL
jgi:TolA-binding protein